MKTIDITVTAALRPDLIEETAASVERFLVRDNEGQYHFRVILNIDPAGEEGVTQDEVEAVYRSFFDDIVVFKPEEASFPLAVQRVWNAVTADIAFHAEDSKLLLRSVPLERATSAFENRDRLACFALRALKKPHRAPHSVQHDERHDMDVTEFFHKAVTLQPSFFSRAYVHDMAGFMRPGLSPEKAIKGFDEVMEEDLAKQIHAVAHQYEFASVSRSDVAAGAYYENVGRSWRLKHKLTKPVGTGMGTTWSRHRSILPNEKYLRLWKEVRGRQLRRLWARITGRRPGGEAD